MKTIAQPRLNGARHRTAKAAATLSSFDPTLPEDGALIIAEVLRDQFNALNDDIQTRATQADLDAEVAALNADIAGCATYPWVVNAVNAGSDNAVATVLPQTSNNSNSVAQLTQAAQPYYEQWLMQAVLDKLDELINALRR